jgi:hypothetical protein
MQDIIADVTRDGTAIYTGKPFRLEYAGDMEMQVPGGYGMTPYYRYQGFIRQILDIRQNDYLKDQVNIDPVTNTNVMYQVISIPERFPDGHMEFKADNARTTGFS